MFLGYYSLVVFLVTDFDKCRTQMIKKARGTFASEEVSNLLRNLFGLKELMNWY